MTARISLTKVGPVIAERVGKLEGKTHEQFDLARRRSCHHSLRSGILWISVIARSVLCGSVAWTFPADQSALAGI
jgi:hypothetical protein